ncbi:MAG: hypothetical protein IKE63_06445 [Bacilli bacterium]|nr:hypothetical protein [Bacilli bacterium]
MRSRNRKIFIGVIVIGIIIIIGVFYYLRTTSSKSTEIKLNNEKKIGIDRNGKAVFKFTPEKDGYYNFDLIEYGVAEEESGDLYIYENMKNEIELGKDVYYFKKDNDYYFIDDMHHCLDYGYDCDVSLKLKGYANGTITEDEPLIINEDTVLKYKSLSSGKKTMTVYDNKNISVNLQYENIPENTLISYQRDHDKYYFVAGNNETILVVCNNVNKGTKLVINTTPDIKLWNEESDEND